MFDTLGRITELREARGWSIYHLAKLSGIPQSTIATWYRKGLCPPIDKLEILCNTFGITLSEFFHIENYDNPSHIDLFHKWTLLSKDQQKIIEDLFKVFIQGKEDRVHCD